MSTRCRIGIKNKDGTITSIYCHHDGYVKGGVGEKLVNHYKTSEKIYALMSLGDLDSLGTEPCINERAGEMCDFITLMNPKLYHKWYQEAYPDNKCDLMPEYSYHKSIINSRKELFEKFHNSDCEFLYIFINGRWKYTTGGNSLRFVEDSLGGRK